MSALLYKKGHLKNQVPHCIIYLEDDRKRVPVALGKLMSKEIKHPTLGGGMLISFYVDLCRSMLRILLITMSVLPWCSWATPPFLKIEGIK